MIAAAGTKRDSKIAQNRILFREKLESRSL